VLVELEALLIGMAYLSGISRCPYHKLLPQDNKHLTLYSVQAF